MDWYDRQIMQYVLRWIPFGGPPDDEMLPRFGLTPGQFRNRFREIVSTLTRNQRTLDEADRELLASTIYAFVSESRRPQSDVVGEDWIPRTTLF